MAKTAKAAKPELIWEAFPKQGIFLVTFADVDEVLFGGAAGPGKTEALLIYAAQRRLKHPGSSGLFIRRTYAQLTKEGGAIPMSHELYGGIASWNAELRKWTFPNGSVQEFGHCQEESDKYNYQGSQYLDVCWDELTQFTETMYTYIAFSRGRNVKEGLQTQLRAATNPGGIGHKWVKKRFVDVAPPYKIFKETWLHPISHEPLTLTRAFVPATVYDNPRIVEHDPKYILYLKQLPENERRALLEGRWDLFEGQAFDEWNPALHVVRPFQVPVEWPRWYAADYGYLAPWCCLWFTKDMELWREEGIPRYYCYHEMYKAGLPAHHQALQIKEFAKDQRIWAGVADASMWAGYKAGTSLIRYYENLGLKPLQGPTGAHRVTSKGHVHWLLGKAVDDLPRLRIFSNCHNLIRTLPLLQLDEKKPEDVEQGGEDHAYAALSYWGHLVATPIIRHAPVAYRIGA